MADSTRRRGSGDTSGEPFLTRSAAGRAFAIALALAALLHVPFVPSSLIAWLQLFVMMQGRGDAEDLEGEVLIPVDLDLMKEGPKPPGPGAEPEPAPAVAEPDNAVADPAAVASKPAKPKQEESDAGTDAAVDAPADAPTDAEAEAGTDAGMDAEAGTDADAGADADTVAAADAATDAPEDAPDRVAKAGLDAGDGVIPLISMLDAGLDATVEAPDAGQDTALDAGLDASPMSTPADAGAPKVREPVSAAGGPSQLAGKDPNVQILIAGDRIRSHQLGEGFGRILRNIPEWTGFFKDTSIDPIKDLDHMFLAGPQFRFDSSRVVAVMDYNRPDKDIRDAVDTIVTRAKGEWLKDTPVPAAQAKADRADRIFALVPEKNLLVVLPAKEKEQLKKVKGIKPFNKSSPVAIVISMVTPARPFKDIVNLPETWKWLRLAVTPTSDGGADATIEAEDATPEDATKHAQELTNTVELLRAAVRITNPLPFGPRTFDAFDKVTFVADGRFVRATTHLSVRQLKGIMAIVEQRFRDQQEQMQKNQQKPKGQQGQKPNGK